MDPLDEIFGDSKLMTRREALRIESEVTGNFEPGVPCDLCINAWSQTYHPAHRPHGST